MIKLILNNQKGFTFIELLIAMAVFTIGVLAMYLLHFYSISGNATAHKLSQATNSASDQIEQLLALSYADTVSGNTTSADGKYDIVWVVTPNDPIDNVKTIDITVSTTDVATVRSVSFTSIKADALY